MLLKGILQMQKKCIGVLRLVVGPEHIETLSMVNHFGELYIGHGRLADAEKTCHRALSRFEKAFGSEHPSTLVAVDNLGRLYALQEHLANAEKCMTALWLEKS